MLAPHPQFAEAICLALHHMHDYCCTLYTWVRRFDIGLVQQRSTTYWPGAPSFHPRSTPSTCSFFNHSKTTLKSRQLSFDLGPSYNSLMRRACNRAEPRRTASWWFKVVSGLT
jgi:hypothetical protein